MRIDNNPDEEPAAPAVASGQKEAQSKGKRKSLSNVRRDLSDEELASPGVQKTLLDEIERLDSDLADAKDYQSKYYEADKKADVLEQKLKTHQAFEIISASCLTGGALLLGYLPSVWEAQPTGWILFAVGLLAVFGGIISKVVKI
ncbi:hypothetical protein RI570_04270 [Brucella pseudogrignonensis]|uniref:hypothetical protein n=1 Tax=Brucella TaxID=234 RepID=UPI00114C94BE|nr:MULTISPECIES: hypothetical protein [Brucella]MDT6939359.1 hypothetical protein [Brucella pseudogrignonensis]QMV26916.1 hypothetical protein GRI33_08335 [Brucella sp. BO3]